MNDMMPTEYADRYELQYYYIPQLVDAVNEGYLPSTALHMVKEWDRWMTYRWEEGFYVDRLEVGNDHTVVFYNFPEPENVPEALYGAVLINNVTGKAAYYTLEAGYKGSWMLGSKTTKSHRTYGSLGSRDRSVFLKWVTDKIV